MNEMTSPGTAFGRVPAYRREPFSFTGKTKEYFGIWIVNVLLTILTLGIYSAWAKVRRMRYFYGNTHLAGASFDYHARPGQILVGRIIVLVLLAVYNITLNVAPAIGLVLFVAFFLATPWFIFRGMRFSARVTSYRNIRFDFKGGYGGAFLAYLVGPMVAVLSAGILIPLASRWAWRYQLNNLTYGDRPVVSDPQLGAIYRQWGASALIALAMLILIALIIWPTSRVIGTDFADDTSPGLIYLILLEQSLPLLVAGFLLYGAVGLFYQAGVRNVALNATRIDFRHQMVSTVGRRRYAWISISNIAATILTLGLARPWAAIRMAKYLSTVTALDASGPLDDFAASIKQTGGATGSEFMDFEGFDLGF
jgi:uncharacterized membrane protein YjgN (DUF898 family)